MESHKALCSVLLATMCLSGCAALQGRLSNIGKEPELERVQAPQERVEYRPVKWPSIDSYIPTQEQNANSLWQEGSRSFFKDQRARSVGDILKVTVKIKEKAKLDNETETGRSSSETVNMPNLFGLQELLTGWLPGAATPATLVNVTGSSTQNGTGTVDREEEIETEIAAMVTQILPNGNLVINGHQEIRVNHEIRAVSVEGIVRPEDISAANSVDSTQIAEARISYGGRGALTNVQQPRYGAQVVEAISPF